MTPHTDKIVDFLEDGTEIWHISKVKVALKVNNNQAVSYYTKLGRLKLYKQWWYYADSVLDCYQNKNKMPVRIETKSYLKDIQIEDKKITFCFNCNDTLMSFLNQLADNHGTLKIVETN